MAITFGYAVKYNGKYYPPNTPIPEPKKADVEKPVENVEKPTKRRKGGSDA